MTLLTCLRGNDDLTITTLYLTHGDLTINLGYDSRVRRITSLEELSYTRQTSSDITTLGSGTWNLDEGLTSLDGLAILYDYVATYREAISTDNLTVGTDDVTGGNLCTVTRLCNNLFGQTCGLISLSTEGNTFNDIIELQGTGKLCHDNSIERIPLSNLVTLGNLVTIMEIERRTIRHIHC